MARWQRVFLAACGGVIAYTLAYVIVDYARLPRLVYFQHERELQLRTRVSDPLPSAYVGMWLWALLAGVVVAAAIWIATRWRRREASQRTLGLMMAWSITSLALAGAYYTWNNWP
jgi:glycerol uptake facilitator-like aquaporin